MIGLKKILTRDNIGFGGLQWFFWSGFCTFFAFFVMYLQTKGYDEIRIGLAMSAISIVSIAAQPFWGYYSDKKKTVRKVLIVSLLTSGAAALLFPMLYNSMTAVLIICVVISFTENSMPTMIDSWTINSMRRKPGLDYGLTRGMGSLGYAITAVIFGVLLEKYGYNLMFYAHMGLLVIAVGFCFLVDDIGTFNQEEDSKPVKLNHRKHDAQKSGMFIFFLLSSTLVITGFRAGFTFFPLLLGQKGGGSGELGLSLFIMCVSEVPVLFFSQRLLRRFRDTSLIITSMIFFIIRILLHSVVPSILGLVLIQAMQAVSFALFLPASIQYVNRIAPEGFSSTYLTIATSCYMGVGSILGSVLGGIVIDRLGMSELYILSGLSAFIGTIIFLISTVYYKQSTTVYYKQSANVLESQNQT